VTPFATYPPAGIYYALLEKSPEMTENSGEQERLSPLDFSAGLYHEDQADGFPYDEPNGRNEVESALKVS
jgi:hypothetical protein